MIKITADTVGELAKTQRYIINGMLSEGTADFDGTFLLSNGNPVLAQEGYWKEIVGEILPDGTKNYIDGYEP